MGVVKGERSLEETWVQTTHSVENTVVVMFIALGGVSKGGQKLLLLRGSSKVG